jgi:hypothetical protein
MPSKTFITNFLISTKDNSAQSVHDKKINNWEKENEGKIKIINCNLSITSFSGMHIGIGEITSTHDFIIATEIFYKDIQKIKIFAR